MTGEGRAQAASVGAAEASPGPLAGIRVIELTTMITGPLAGMMLADWGADVIKVENPEGGDPFRSFRGGMYSPHFCAYNRNKRSVAIDLQIEAGKESLAALLRECDVVLDNFRPGVLDRLGFSDEQVAELNPRAVRCHISGFGSSGPYAARPAYDAVAQAVAGMSSLFLQPEDPKVTGPTIGDNVTGHYACQGILAALVERNRTGRGRRLDVNMLEATMAFMPDPFAYYTQMDLVSDPFLRAHTSQSYAWRCADGKLVAVHLSSQPKFWEAFTRAIGREDLREDARFASRQDRISNYPALNETLAPVFLAHSRAQWVELLVAADVPVAPVYDVTEVFDDPQVRHLNSFVQLQHAQMGAVVAVRRPVWLDQGREDQPHRAPPMLGEHTDEVLGALASAQPDKLARTGSC